MKLNSLNYSAVRPGKELKLHIPAYSLAQFLHPSAAEVRSQTAGVEVVCDGRSSSSVCLKLFCIDPEILLGKRTPNLSTLVCLVKKSFYVFEATMCLMSLNLMNYIAAFTLKKNCRLNEH